MNFVIYNAATGEILRTGGAPEAMIELQAQAGEAVLADEAANDALQYIDLATLQVIDRPAAGIAIDAETVIADGAAMINMTGIPTGTRVTLRGEGSTMDAIIDDGALALMFEAPGAYDIAFTPPFPMLPVAYRITATEPVAP